MRERPRLSSTPVPRRATRAGIVIKHENMEYKRAVHYTAVVLELCAKTRKFVRELFESPDVS